MVPVGLSPAQPLARRKTCNFPNALPALLPLGLCPRHSFWAIFLLCDHLGSFYSKFKAQKACDFNTCSEFPSQREQLCPVLLRHLEPRPLLQRGLCKYSDPTLFHLGEANPPEVTCSRKSSLTSLSGLGESSGLLQLSGSTPLMHIVKWHLLRRQVCLTGYQLL